MKRYAQIDNGKVYGIFEYEKLPEFAPDIVMIDITGRSDIEAGMFYDGEFHDTDPSKTPEILLQEAKAKRKAELREEFINDALSAKFIAIEAAPNETAVKAVKLKG
jgi:hypothetical protein